MLKKINENILKNINNDYMIDLINQSNNHIFLKKLLYKILKNKSKDILENEEKIIDDILTIDKSFDNKEKEIKVYLLCNWCSSKELCNLWNKMSKGNFKWNNIKIVSTYPADYILIINAITKNSKMLKDINIDFSKTIIFQMEANIKNNIKEWGFWGDLTNIEDKLKFIGYHDNCINNLEWHLSKTYNELKNEEIIKNPNYKHILSAIVSNKNSDPGQQKRINFLKFLDSKDDIEVHVFGTNDFNWKNYKGKLPEYNKDNGLFPYYYTFNAENCKKKNYVTEKLIDGILSECLTFYWGCPNVKEIFNEKSFVELNLHDFNQDYISIKKNLENFEWENRIKYIREEKNTILEEKQFFPNLEKIILNNSIK
jgi:hypothetical protein